jgi:hypothetical protein
MQQKPTKVAQILGIINNTFKPTLVQKFSRGKLYNALAIQCTGCTMHWLYDGLAVQCTGCTVHWLSPVFTWQRNLKPELKEDKKELTSFEMKFFTRTAG